MDKPLALRAGKGLVHATSAQHAAVVDNWIGDIVRASQECTSVCDLDHVAGQALADAALLVRHVPDTRHAARFTLAAASSVAARRLELGVGLWT